MSSFRRIAACAAVLIAGCSFGTVAGVALLADDVAVGVLSVDEEGEHIYVGTYTTGTQWDPQPKITAYDDTGSVIGSTPAWGLGWKFRAVSTDPGNDSVWTLHDNGSIVEWPADLAAYSGYESGFFEAPSLTTLVRMCDLEVFDDDVFLATGIAESNGSYRGFFQLVYPHPLNGTWSAQTFSVPLDLHASPGASCPRVSADPFEADRIAVLWADYSGVGDRVSFADIESYTSAGLTYERVTWTGDDFDLAVSDDKYGHVDITTANDGVVLVYAYQYGSATAAATAKMYLDDGTLEDVASFTSLLAVDTASWTHNNADYLWWAGEESETGSDFGLGSITVSN